MVGRLSGSPVLHAAAGSVIGGRIAGRSKYVGKEVRKRSMEEKSGIANQQPENIVTLLDENGAEVRFDLLMAFDYEKRRYIALLPLDKVENVGDDEVVLLEVLKEDGGEVYQSIENPILLDEVFDAFCELFDDMLDEEESADGEDGE